MQFAAFDLTALRGSCASVFNKWDAAIEEGRYGDARSIRRQELWPHVRESLRDPSLANPGIYMFLDNAQGSGWASVTYIGQTEARLERRIEDYIKDDSCWDANLIGDDPQIEDVFWRRLRPLMTSTDETLRGYAAKHAATIRKTRGSSLFVAGFDEIEDKALIVPTEAALIAVAWSHGAPLENDKVERLPTVKQRSRAISICQQMFAGWESLGLNSALSQVARAGLNAANASPHS